MTGKQLNIACLVLTSIVDMGTFGAPEGPLYAVLMSEMDLDGFNHIIGFIVHQGWATKRGNVLHATDKGRALAAKITAALAENPALASKGDHAPKTYTFASPKK